MELHDCTNSLGELLHQTCCNGSVPDDVVAELNVLQ